MLTLHTDEAPSVRATAAYALLDLIQYDSAQVVPRLIEMALTPRDAMACIDPFGWQPQRESTESVEVRLRMANNSDVLADQALREFTISHGLFPPYLPVEP